MGCHTWFYKKVERSYEEAKNIWMEHQKGWIERATEICNNPDDECRLAYDWSQDTCNSFLAVAKRQLQIVEKGLCRVAVMNHQPSDDDGRLYEFVDGNLYCTHKTLPHNIFRIGKYPEDKLFDFYDTIRFCRVKNNIDLSHEQVGKLRKFWDDYPDGMIRFG